MVFGQKKGCRLMMSAALTWPGNLEKVSIDNLLVSDLWYHSSWASNHNRPSYLGAPF
jgi:hypothetical protein